VPQRPDGKPASVERVAFTRPAAERIARVVRDVELGGRDSRGFGLGVRLQDSGTSDKVFRVCTFTGAWNLDGAKTVTIRNTTATLVAINLFAAIETVTSNVTRNCAVAKDRGVWYLIAAEC